MENDPARSWLRTDTLIAFIVLAFLTIYTYGLLFIAPYPGFYFNPTDGRVLEVYVPEDPQLLVGDVIQQIGDMSLDEFRQDRNLHFLQKAHAGQPFEMVVERAGERIAIPWIYTGFNRTEFVARFFNIWWLAYIFWFIGLSAKLHLRPQDTQWRLFVTSNYLIGMFIMLGSVSSYRIMGSSMLLRVTAWLILSVYLHFHWIFPTSLRRFPPRLKIIFYVVFGVISLAELFQLVPGSLYFLAVILAFGGSIVLLLLHYIFQPEHRREVRILVFAALLALFPVILVSIVSSVGQLPQIGPLALLALPVLPGAYFYILYRRSLGGLELRTNRRISLYMFFILLGTVLLLAVSFLSIAGMSRNAIIFGCVVVSLSTMFLGIQFFPAFQSLVERRLLGIKLPAQHMVENYSARIVTSTSLYGLLKLLEEEVFPSLLIRQYAFVRDSHASGGVILSRDVDVEQVPEDALMNLLASSPSGCPPSITQTDPSLGWVRLALPLQVGANLIGAWLLGRRDPDDQYPQAEFPILQSLANQTAIAMSNIIQTERLKLMYEANINRYEQERLRLGHELHDSLLNEMAAMLMKHDPDMLPREFQESFDGLIVRLREIVTYLRPPMLVYGLKYALDGLADNLSERNHDVVRIVSEIQTAGDCRYPETVEHNVYRIVQEACENALKYAHANAIRIVGELAADRIDIQVSDDGIGFRNNVSLLLDEMVVNKHYGLAGMHERADLIGATIKLDSESNKGTRIHILWNLSAD